MTNYSGGGTPLCDANEYDGRGIQLEPSEVETNKRSITDPNVGGFKTYVASHIARKLERELSAARSALAEKEREVEKNTIERCAKAAADVPHSTPFASRVITACVVAIRSLKSAPPASPTGRKE